MKGEKKEDKIIIVKVSPEFTKFYCLSDWPCVCRSAVRAFLLAGRISQKSFSQSMCQTGMQRINLQPETKIWKCPEGPGGMFLTPNSFSDLSDPTCPTAARAQLCQAIKAKSVAAAELGQEHQAQQNLLTITCAAELEGTPASCGKLGRAARCAGESPGAVRAPARNSLCSAHHPLLLACSCQTKQAPSWGVAFGSALWFGSCTEQLEGVSSSVWPGFG